METPPNSYRGVECRWGVTKIPVFDRYLASLFVVNFATVRCCKQSASGMWQVGDTHHW